MRKLVWGLIGGSTIARQHMVRAIQAEPGSRIGWIASGCRVRAEEFATDSGISRATDRVGDVLADPEVTCVYISSTNEKHGAQTLAALAAGKHVLCEKPLAMGLADALAMVAAARAAGLVLATNHHLRCSGSHRAIRDLIAAGRIGRVLSVRIHHAVHLPPHLQGWRIDNPKAGGGVIGDITVHDADTVHHLLGEVPVSVVAEATSSGMGLGVEDSAMSVWTMPGGAQIMAHESFTHAFAGTGLEVHGTEGSIFGRGVMTQVPVGVVELVTAQGREVVPFADHDLYAQGVAEFAAALHGQGRPAATGADGVIALAVALAVAEAARTGRRVDVDCGGLA